MRPVKGKVVQFGLSPPTSHADWYSDRTSGRSLDDNVFRDVHLFEDDLIWGNQIRH